MARNARNRNDDTQRATLFEVRPLADAMPVTSFMCFRTPDDDVFIKCDWNPVEKRFNLNCHQVGIEECGGGI